MHPSSLRLLWPLIFGFAVLLLAVAATALVSTAQQNASLAVRDLLQTENRLNRVMAMAIDAETGQRGYLLTGRDSYLAMARGIASRGKTGRISATGRHLCAARSKNLKDVSKVLGKCSFTARSEHNRLTLFLWAFAGEPVELLRACLGRGFDLVTRAFRQRQPCPIAVRSHVC